MAPSCSGAVVVGGLLPYEPPVTLMSRAAPSHPGPGSRIPTHSSKEAISRQLSSPNPRLRARYRILHAACASLFSNNTAMPRRKSARNAARLAILDGTTASNQVLGKRAASELPEAQECIKVETVGGQRDTGPPDDGRQAREVPCVGCLVGLANWMPEDGEPKLCFDKAGKPPTPFASTYPADASIPV